MVKAKEILKDSLSEINEPMPLGESGFSIFKKGKKKIMIIYEDLSYQEFYVKMDDYVFTVRKKNYLIVSDAFIRGKKFDMTIYYYNNPLPIKFKHEVSKMSTKNLDKVGYAKIKSETDKQLASVTLDAKALKSAFDSNILHKMYFEPSPFSTKNMLIILVVVAIIVMVILQGMGVIDLTSMFVGGR